MGVWVVTGLWKKAPDDTPSISAEDILNDEAMIEDLEELHLQVRRREREAIEEDKAA